jgi:hypothetical protein
LATALPFSAKVLFSSLQTSFTPKAFCLLPVSSLLLWVEQQQPLLVLQLTYPLFYSLLLSFPSNQANYPFGSAASSLFSLINSPDSLLSSTKFNPILIFLPSDWIDHCSETSI